MGCMDDLPTRNFDITEKQSAAELQEAFSSAIEHFLNEFVFLSSDCELSENGVVEDGIVAYSKNLINNYMVLADIKNAVSSGN